MKRISFFVFVISHLVVSCFAHDNIYLSLSASQAKRSGIAIEVFVPVGKDANTASFAKYIQEIVKNDLILSRYFNVVDKPSGNFNTKEKLLSLKHMNVFVILAASVSNEGKNLVVKIKMTDVSTGSTIWENKYTDKSCNYRYLAHKISDEIVKRFTGETGIACSKIAFINDGTKFKELYIIDYDGHNLRRLTKDNRINVLPKWSPRGDQIIYTSYLCRNPDLFILNIVENKRKILSKYQGLNVAGSFAPDGERILLTLSMKKYPNLYLINLAGGILRKMTEGMHIDTSPSFAPNGQEIVFISDRAGYPQLYIMNINGGNVRRLTTNGLCDSPEWSPRGDKIVFTMKEARGNHDLYIYDLPTAKIIKLTNNQRNNENPTWSPDGRFVVFYSNRSGKGEIYIMAIDGSGTRKLTEISGTSYTPAWSPVLTR
jgi:TolB protein